MWWIVMWTVVTLAGLVGIVSSANSVRFERRVTREMRDITLSAGASVASRPAADLPAPVRRYLAKAIGTRQQGIRTASLRHGGTFRPSLDGAWLPIKGVQRFTADPPAFVWWGRVRVVPGVWIDARDRSVGGVGNMFVTAQSTVTLADRGGPQLDQGALGRLLGEMTWFPTALLDERYVRWSAIDEHRALATLQVGDRAVSATFEFGDDDLPATFSADRYRDIGGGQAVLTPFVGRSSDYRPVDGILVPHRVVGAWVIDGTPVEYVRFDVERIDFDVPR